MRATLWDIPANEPEKFQEPIDVYAVKEKPLFNGGDPMVEFRKYIVENLRYPTEASENGIEGRVTIEFTIDEKGRMTNVRVIMGVHPSLDEEALRVIGSSPAWTPGKQNGMPVKVRYYFPVNYRLAR